jgi:hypothetical protein
MTNERVRHAISDTGHELLIACMTLLSIVLEPLNRCISKFRVTDIAVTCYRVVKLKYFRYC